MSEEQWIIVRHWGDFQHYKNRDPTWIKNYVRLLHDEAYAALSSSDRGALHLIWLLFAAADGQLYGGELTADCQRTASALTTRRQLSVSVRQLEVLNHAGFIEFCASKPPRISASLEVEVEKDKNKNPPTPLSTSSQTPNPNGRARRKVKELEEDRPLINVVDACQMFIEGQAWDETFDEQAMLTEFGRIERGRRTEGTIGNALSGLLEQWKATRQDRYDIKANL